MYIIFSNVYNSFGKQKQYNRRENPTLPEYLIKLSLKSILSNDMEVILATVSF
jgi:hypothetical protein